MTIGRIPSVEGGIQPTIFDAKGDVLVASAADTPARLAVGNNGEQLLADSSATTGLRWQGDFAAGKNKIINGDFGIWQRGTSFSTSDAYTADRWVANADATFTLSRQTFTPGTAPVAGYEGTYFARFARNAGGTYGTGSYQKIEDVRTFAGQTVTLSFWAKADATVTIAPYYNQVFGSGGSAGVGAAIGSGVTLTTSWTRYSLTFTMPSISGKTIGTSSYVEIYVSRYIGSAATTIDLWGVQLEAGSVATAFQTATGTLAGELSACQRYYQITTSGYAQIGFGARYNSTTVAYSTPIPVQMRTTPTVTYVGTVSYSSNGTGGTLSSPSATNSSPGFITVLATSSITPPSAYPCAVEQGTTQAFSAEL
jgi:hypothetical protein